MKANITPELIGKQAALLLENDEQLVKELSKRSKEDAQKYLAVAAIYAIWKANK